MHSEPQPEHQWLQQLVGEWTVESEALMEPGKPPETFTGSERVRSLGGLWVVLEGQVEMPGVGTGTTMMSLGYDPETQRYVGTWIGSMMTHLWLYDGSLDESGTVLTLEAEGPDMSGQDKLGKYRDIIEVKSADHRVMRSQFLGDDGQWQHFMTANYRRKT